MSVVGRMMGYGRDENYDRAIRYYDEGNYQEAIDLFVAVLQKPQDSMVTRLAKFYSAEAYSQLGQQALKRNDYSAAAKQFVSALEIHPNYPDLHYYLAVAARKAGDIEVAQGHIAEALVLNPKFAKAILEQGIQAYQQGEYESGLKRAEQAISLDPSLRNDRYERAKGLSESGEHETAMVALESIPEALDDVMSHARLADGLYKKGLYQQAAEEYEKALAIKPKFADLRCHYGLALHALGKVEQSIQQFNQALEVNPNYVEARLHLAVTFRDSDQPLAAQAEFLRVLETDPDNIVARNNIR